jgi:hypothetical protein
LGDEVDGKQADQGRTRKANRQTPMQFASASPRARSRNCAPLASPVLTAALVAWLKGGPGRKIRVEFHLGGKVKTVEAQTEEQILSLAKALNQEAQAEVSKTK